MWATVKAHNPPVRLMRTNLVAADTQNKLHRRPTNYNHPTTHQGTRPAPICTPRGGQRYKPRPEPRRHHLTHAADMGHTSPQRRHQYKAPCIVPLPGAAAATHNTPQTKATLPCINLRYKAGWLYFLLEQKLRQNRMESRPCVIHCLRNR